MAKNKKEETGVILKIQKQTGCLLFVIGAAMLAFVLTDFFKSGSSMFGGSDNVIGEIAGEEISNQELQAGVEELKLIYQGSNFDESSLREQAWSQLIQEKIIKKEHGILGLTTSTAELNDALFGPNPDPIVVRNFTDPETKQFDPNVLRQFIDIDMQEDSQKYSNYMNFLEIPLKEAREGEKYEMLVKAGIYTTKLDARSEFDREEYRKSAVAVGLPYTLIEDSTISYEESDLKAFLNENSQNYQQIATRDIEYVVLNVYPSAEDTASKRDELAALRQPFIDYKRGDSAFLANKKSLRQYNPNFVRRGGTGLSADVEDQLFAADSGFVSEVTYTKYKDGPGVFGLYKVMGSKADSVSMMRAEHVIIPPGDEAEAKAATMLADLKAGRTTVEQASKDNYDGTAKGKGDLGWFLKDGAQGLAPKEVKDKVFASSVGSYFVVKSNKGHHVVHVTAGPSRKLIHVAALERAIVPGLEADRKMERAAGEIQFQAQQNDDFETVVEAEGQGVREAKGITASNPTIQGLPDAKDVARWLFKDKVRVGDVSDVIDLQDRYLIAKCTAIKEKGTASLDDNRNVITSDYIKDKKGDMLADQINEALASAGDAESVAKALSTVTKLVPSVNLNSAQVSSVGAEPKVAGAILGLAEGKRSEPIKGVNGVYVVWGTGQVQAGDPTEFVADDMKGFLNERSQAGVGENVLAALRKKAEIEDKRYLLY